MPKSVHSDVGTPRWDEATEGPGQPIDSLLVDFLSSRSDEAFTALTRKVAPRLLRYLTALGCKKDEAEDLAQDVLYILSRKAHTIREPQYMWAWLYKVAHNAFLQSVRKCSRQVPSVDIEDIGENSLPNIPASPIHERRGSSFSDWMTRLEIGEQQVMVLRFVEDCDYIEIAQILEIPIGTVKSRLFQAKKKLIKHLAERKPNRR
jgi:RNA polymerase sigma-70 factor (ECF subfamily)